MILWKVIKIFPVKTKSKKRLEKIKKKIEDLDKEENKSLLARFKFLKSMYYAIPSFYRGKIEEEARYAGFKRIPAEEVALIMSFLMFLSIITSLYIWLIVGARWYFWISTFLLLSSIAVFSPYIVFVMSAESRRKRLEVFLPDLLVLTSANIKSGLTIDKALLFAARPEFGELSDIVRRTSFEIYGGKEVGEALQDLSKEIKSEVFKKTVSLLVEGLKSGGAVAKLLEETANDIKNTEILQKEIKSSVVMYIMFIFIAAVLGAPSLFGISVFLVKSTTSMWHGDMGMNQLSVNSNANVQLPMSFMSVSKPNIDISGFELFAIISIIITNLFAGIIISLIQTGRFRNSLKYSPLFISISLFVYYIVKEALFKLFGSLLGM